MALGCSNDPVSLDNVPDIDGAWNYSEVLSDGGSCNFFGTLTIVQSNETFQGSYVRTQSCTSGAQGGNDLDIAPQSGRISDGQVVDDNIRFDIGRCEYRGILTETPPSRASGSVSCLSESLSGNASIAAGTWQLERLSED